MATITKAPAKPKNPNNLKGLIRRPDLEFRQLGMDMALYDPSTGNLHMLNATAASVWYHLTEDRTVKNIAEVLGLSFNMSSAEEIKSIAMDVEWVIAQFKRLNLVVPRGSKIPPPLKKAPLDKRYIPDQEISSIAKGYLKPTFKSYSLIELRDIFEAGSGIAMPTPFADWAGSNGYSRIA